MGRLLMCLAGTASSSAFSIDRSIAESLSPPSSYDSLLRLAVLSAPTGSGLLPSPWSSRVYSLPDVTVSSVLAASLHDNTRLCAAAVKRYKPVDRKVRPVPSYMPKPSAQQFRPVTVSKPVLSHHPPPLSAFSPTTRLTQERLDNLLQRVPAGFLQPAEIDLLVHVVTSYAGAIAWTDDERGTLSRAYFPDYEIPVIEHVPWIQEPLAIPHAIQDDVRRLLYEQERAGKYEHSSASYRSRMFPVSKKENKIRLVIDLQRLNAVTVRDSALPPRPDDFAEAFVGHTIYGVADLYSGFDARTLAVQSRDLTTFHSIIGPLRTTVLPQGFTNSMPEFQRCTTHALRTLIELGHVGVFIDDGGIKGPPSYYNHDALPDNPEIRRFVFEYAETLAWTFAHFIEAGLTASGWKLILATPEVSIVGSIAAFEGWKLSHGIAAKVTKWPVPQTVSEVRGFLGVAGVGRRWIKGFSLIAKPLTALCRVTDDPFEFSSDALAAFNELKARISSTPVLRKIDYDKARAVGRPPRKDDDGLVILAVDSSMYGAGWVLYQVTDTGRHPAFYGSCTFSAIESRYSQPKLELYGVFRAIKAMRYRIWGCHFRLEVDAISLKQTLKEPDLPNAPMTRWVTYLQQFDYEVVHIPATKGVAQDGLSRRRPADDDSDESGEDSHLVDALNYLSTQSQSPLTLRLHRVLESVYDTMPPQYALGHDAFAVTHPSVPLARPVVVSLGFFDTARQQAIQDHKTRARTEPFPRDHIVFNGNIEHGRPRWHFLTDAYKGGRFRSEVHRLPPEELPFHPSWLRMQDDVSYQGREFVVRSTPIEYVDLYLFGDELVPFEICSYSRYNWHTDVPDASLVGRFGESLRRITRRAITPVGVGDSSWMVRTDHRLHLPNTSFEHCDCIPAIGHPHRVPEPDGSSQWEEIIEFLTTGTLPQRLKDAPARDHARFRALCSRFFYAEGRLWRRVKDGFPLAVITDVARRSELIAEAHELAGHRGRDATYKLLQGRMYWPNMYCDVCWHVASCNACQFLAKARPIEPMAPTLSLTMFRKWYCDTIHMGDGRGGYRYLMHAHDSSSGWPEGRGSRKNTAENWARFLFEEVISRFGCMLFLVCDGGAEFKGAVRILAEQYHVFVILSSPYHPEGNGMAERHGDSLQESIRRCSAARPSDWPLYVTASLWAIRTTTYRATGYTPYFLVYGQEALLPFDLYDRSWHVLPWDSVTDTAGLIALRMKQLARRDEDLGHATEAQYQSRKRAVDDKMKRHARRIRDQPLEPGMWVLQHETWLTNQHGHKSALRWAGPYVIHQSFDNGVYALRELDGTLRTPKVHGNRLKPFYFRTEFQSMSANWLTASSALDVPPTTPAFTGPWTSYADLAQWFRGSPEVLELYDEYEERPLQYRIEYPLLPLYELSYQSRPFR